MQHTTWEFAGNVDYVNQCHKIRMNAESVGLHIEQITAFSRSVWLMGHPWPFERVRGLPVASALW